MKILVAPNTFKGSLDCFQVSEHITEGLKQSCPEAVIDAFPLADGGDYTSQVLHRMLAGEWQKVATQDPLGRPIEAGYSLVRSSQTAYIDISSASGLHLLAADEFAPMTAHTQGTGELILDAIKKQARHIFIGLGGSATIDGACGILQAIGFRFYDHQHQPLTPIAENLRKLATIYKPSNEILNEVTFTLLCDVNNPLLGKRGAAQVYGPQKGASPQQVTLLEQGLAQLAQVINQQTGININDLPGAGAAGGAGATLQALLNAQYESGIDHILQTGKCEERIKNCDWIITGEGKFDEQTLQGKAPMGIAQIAKKYHLPVLFVTGATPLNILENSHFDAVFPIGNEPCDFITARNNTAENLKRTAFNLGNLMKHKS